MIQSNLDSYKTANIDTADQGKLILIVYDWAIRQCKIALEKFPEAEPRCNALAKAQNAVTELMISLNMDAGGEIAKNLYQLYDYMNRRLVHANLKREQRAVEEVISLLSNLRDAWIQAADKVRKEKAPAMASTGLAVVG